MRAVVIARPGGPEVLELRDVPAPEPGPDELLVRVRATALNRADLLQREGRYPAPPGVPADIPGLEFAGEVARAGARAARWREGDRVFGLVAGGAHAEYVVALGASVAAWTRGRGADVVLDLLGGPYVAASLATLAPRGRLVLIGTIAGRRAEVDLGLALSRRVTIRGTVLRTRPIEERILATGLFAAEVLPVLAAGTVCPTVDSAFPLADVSAAHERLAGNATFGKVVLDVIDD